jgi:hypothetical protein
MFLASGLIFIFLGSEYKFPVPGSSVALHRDPSKLHHMSILTVKSFINMKDHLYMVFTSRNFL